MAKREQDSLDNDFTRMDEEVAPKVPYNTTRREPTQGAIDDLTIDEDADQQTVDLTGIAAGWERVFACRH